jgi:hypothetical protein
VSCAKAKPPIEPRHVAGWLEVFQAPMQEEMALFDEVLAIGPEQA